MSGPQYLLHTLECQQGAIRAVRFSADGNYCMTCGSDRTIALWNPYKNLKIKVYEGSGYESLDVRGTHDNSKLACCGMDKNVKIIDVATGKNLRKFKGHAGRVNCIALNDDSSVVLSGSIDSTVRAWDLKSNTSSEIQIWKDAKDSITKICLSNFEIFTASADGCVRRYDLRNGRAEVDRISLKGVSAIDITNKHDKKGENFKCVLVTTLEGENFLLDTQDGSKLAQYETDQTKSAQHSLFQIDNCLSQDDELVFVGSECGYVYCWDLLTPTLKYKLEHTASDPNQGRPSFPNPNQGPSKLVVASLSSHPTKNHILTSAGNCVYLWTLSEET